MEQLADPGTVLLTPATLALAEDFIQVRSLGPTLVKGINARVEIYEFTGATAVIGFAFGHDTDQPARRLISWRSESACSRIELGTTKAGVSTPG